MAPPRRFVHPPFNQSLSSRLGFSGPPIEFCRHVRTGCVLLVWVSCFRSTGSAFGIKALLASVLEGGVWRGFRFLLWSEEARCLWWIRRLSDTSQRREILLMVVSFSILSCRSWSTTGNQAAAIPFPSYCSSVPGRCVFDRLGSFWVL